jgi:hypothetical protein
MWKKMSIQNKIIVPILLSQSWLFPVCFFIWFPWARGMSREEAYEKSEGFSLRHGAECQVWLESGNGCRTYIGTNLEGIKQSGVAPDRAVMNAMLARVLEANPGFLGVWNLLGAERA